MRWACDPVQADVLAGVLDQDPSRNLTSEAYWQRLQPHLRNFGISRVADITGLDRVGFPVAQAVRANARSNAVTQGKAQALEGAAVGAVLECLEMAMGEHLDRFATVLPQNESIWRSFAPGLDQGVVWPDLQTEYIACWDVLRDKASALPRDLISTDFRRDAPAAEAPILRHSIGLGAGTHFAAAVLHGILECIEADARLREEAWGGARRLALSLEDPIYGSVLGQVERARLRVAVHGLPCKGGVFTAQASLMEKPGAISLPLPAIGYGARLNMSSAILAALSEALQARLAVISGAREDITQRFYTHKTPLAALEAEWARHGTGQFETPDAPSVTQSLSQITARIGRVFGVPLYWNSDLPLAVVRIVAPDLIADPLRLATP